MNANHHEPGPLRNVFLAACFSALVAGATVCSCRDSESPLGPAVERGRHAYLRACAGCHGEAGDGRGSAALLLPNRPRSFLTDAFRTAPRGGVPTDDALLEIVKKGFPQSGMPSFAYMSDAELRSVIAYLKQFFAKRKR
jgi:mono/diheme cytochrome c family protein